MLKHYYKGWTIYKSKEGYIAERDKDCHIAPETYRLLKHAKEAIDSGEANLTRVQFKAKIYEQDLKAGLITVDLLRHLSYHGDKAAALLV